MANGTSTTGTSSHRSNMLAATIRLPPDRPPNRKESEPANDHDAHAHNTEQCRLISDERRIPEDSLNHAAGDIEYPISKQQRCAVSS